MQRIALFAPVLLAAACGVDTEQVDDVRIVPGFATSAGEEISFIVTGEGDDIDVIVRSNHPSNIASEVMVLAQEMAPLELWLEFSDEDAPAELWDHYLAIGAENFVAEVIEAGPRSLNTVYEDVDSGEGDCSAFASAYTWTNRYVSGSVTTGVTASLSTMERFVTGACNKSSNSATETLMVYLDVWTSSISGWQGLHSEQIVRGESVEYSRYLTTCSSYQHRLRVVPSSTSTYYRYAGEWADVTCGGFEI